MLTTLSSLFLRYAAKSEAWWPRRGRLGVVSGHSSMPDPALATRKITTMSQ
jgi:hypothetical protein